MNWGTMITKCVGRYSQITMVDGGQFDEMVKRVEMTFPGTDIRRYGMDYVCGKGDVPDGEIDRLCEDVSRLVRLANSDPSLDVKAEFEKIS